MTIQMNEISAVKFHNNRKGGEKNAREECQFYWTIPQVHWTLRLLNIKELIFNGFFNWLKVL